MSGKRTLVRVTIAGQELSLRSDVSPEHAREIAAYVDRAIRKVIAGGTIVDSQKAAIMAALQITGELFQLRESAEELTARMEGLSDEVRRLLPPAKREPAA